MVPCRKKTFTLAAVLSHSPMSHMQAPMGSEEAAHSAVHLLSITAKDLAVIMDEMVAE